MKKLKALIIESEDGFTISLIGKGGAIISSPTKEAAKSKFLEAMGLCFAVDNLEKFRERGFFQPPAEIEFVEVMAG